MDYKIIVDSGCDITPQIEERLDAISIPLSMRLGDVEYIDDETLDLDNFMKEMKACTGEVRSAAPSPNSYLEAMKSATRAFVVTLSSKLSASFAAAEMSKQIIEEDEEESDIHIFDSKSASAGELLIAVKIRQLLSAGIQKEQLIDSITTFIDNMKTYFVLENYDNLIKNGRVSKVKAHILNVLKLNLILGADGHGEIKLHAKSRGTDHMIKKVMSLINSSGRKTEDENFVICHCNNLPLATKISDEVKSKFNFKEIFIVPVKGVISLYADDKGIIMAF